MHPVPSNKGFSLIEFVAVLALVSGVLLTLTQWREIQHQQRLQQALLETVDHVQLALYGHFRQHNEFPLSISAVGLTDQAVTPWGERVALRHENGELNIVVPTPNNHVLVWLQARLPMAQQDEQRLLVAVPIPLQTLSADLALHRVEVEGRPELNEMQTDLNMNGFAISNFSRLEVDTAQLVSVVADEAVLGQITADDVWLTEQLTAVTADIQRLMVTNAHITNLTAEHAAIDTLEVDSFTATTFSSEQLLANTLSTISLTADLITTEQLLAAQIMAPNFVTEAASFNETHQRLQALEFAWLQCVAQGGCQ